MHLFLWVRILEALKSSRRHGHHLKAVRSPRSLAALLPGTLAPWHPGTLAPWHPGTLAHCLAISSLTCWLTGLLAPRLCWLTDSKLLVRG